MNDEERKKMQETGGEKGKSKNKQKTIEEKVYNIKPSEKIKEMKRSIENLKKTYKKKTKTK